MVKCSYDLTRGDVSGCEDLLDVGQELAGATPRGIAVDTNEHIWVALAQNGEKGAIIEIDPDTKSIISTIGEL